MAVSMWPLQKFVSIRWKFLAVCLICLTLPTIILGALIYQTYYREAQENMRRDLVLIAQNWRSIADIYHEELQRILKREEVLVEKRLESVVQSVQLDIELCGQVPGEEGAARFQQLLDNLAKIRLGRSGYIFILNGQGKYVLSRDRQFDGQDALAIQPALVSSKYKELLAVYRRMAKDEVKILHYSWKDPGQTEERMKVVALVYIPDRDMVVGANMYYTDFKSYELKRILAEELRDRMADQKIGDHGYVFAIDDGGRFMVSHDRLRDGEDVTGYGVSQGGHFFRTLLAQVRRLPPEKTLISSYIWKDFDEATRHRRLVAVAYNSSWGWAIGASASEQDFLKGLAVIRRNVVQTCLWFILLGTLVALFLAAHIARPISRLEHIAAKGDLDVEMDPLLLASNDEIGSLGRALDGMMKMLREKIGELERSRLELELKNKELQTAQFNLIRTEKLAAIGQLAAGVAHEINNPLAYVMSNMETLEEYIRAYEDVLADIEQLAKRSASWVSAEEASADMSTYTVRMTGARFTQARGDIVKMISELQGGLARVKRIVMDLRTFARSEYEDMVEVAVEDVLEQAITIVRGQIRHNAELVLDYDQTPPVRCQTQRIGQVFINILVNASQAIRTGNGRILVRTYVSGDWVCVEISDNGEGIAEEHLSRVFEPFFSTKPVGRGTGLGLSISYDIVKKHGGNMQVRSELGKGTTFTVCLPKAGAGKVVS
ncbi:MAG: HAMP domain-containing protein [Candidatus Omnitrophica bacterium]|nr:HAMP domain-containing protein [Candidatus Omnitrophota bacterium]